MQDALVRACTEQARAIEEPAVEAGSASDEHGREEQGHGAARADGGRQVAGLKHTGASRANIEDGHPQGCSALREGPSGQYSFEDRLEELST